jgi:hypothetical protein
LSGAGIGYGIRPPAPPTLPTSTNVPSSAATASASLAAHREEQAADLSDIE